MKKKILFLVNIDTFFVSHRIEIAKRLLKLGYEVHIATNFVKYKKKLSKIGLITHQIDFTRKSFHIANIFKCIVKIILVLTKVKPNIFHLISIRSIIVGGLASFFVPIKSFVFSITGIGSIYLNNSLISVIRRFLINFCLKLIFLRSKNKSKFIFQNRDDINFLRSIYSIKKKDIITIKGSGIKIKNKKFIKIKNKIPKILMASRIIADKGVSEFIGAANLCKKLNFKAKFLLIGDIDPGNPSKFDLQSIKKLQKNQILKYLPHQEFIFKYIRDSSLVVLPSYREGFPKILIEAASLGRPVITTNVPGCRDAIIKNKSGILVPIKNSKALALAIIKIANDNKLLNKMGKFALSYAKKFFNIDDVVNHHIKVYKKLL